MHNLNDVFEEAKESIKDARQTFNETLKEVEEEIGIDLPVTPLKAKRHKNKNKPGA